MPLIFWRCVAHTGWRMQTVGHGLQTLADYVIGTGRRMQDAAYDRRAFGSGADA